MPLYQMCLTVLLFVTFPSHAEISKQNPLSLAPQISPNIDKNITQQNLYEGNFSNAEMHLSLRAYEGQFTGQMQFKGQTYPLQGQLQADVLTGGFFYENHRHPFTAHSNGQVLILESGGQQRQLQRVLKQVPPKQTKSNLSTKPTHLPPMLEWNLNIEELSPQRLLLEHRSLSTHVIFDFQLYLSHLRQWVNGVTPTEEVGTLLQYKLIPLALSLRDKFNRLGLLSSRINSKLRLKPQEAVLLTQFVHFSNRGSRFFEQWSFLLTQVLQLSQEKNDSNLRHLVKERLPASIQNTVSLAKTLSQLATAVDKIQFRPAKMQAENAYKHLKSSNLLKWETLKSMSETMRDAMTMLNEMQR
jgi:hypothetical protein